MTQFEVIRDPLWDNIRLDQAALAVLDTAPVQRLRYVRQLGRAFLVYPGATHSRFEHALGAYHLFHAIRADLLRRLGRDVEAGTAYETAIVLTGNDAEREFLRRRWRSLGR